MGLTYHYAFRAPATVTPSVLSDFLRGVEKFAVSLGFRPTTVLSAAFDSPERLEFARRLTTGLPLQTDLIKNRRMSDINGVWFYDPDRGSCRVAPKQGVLLVVTDERGCESIFGFFRYPTHLTDSSGQRIGPTDFDQGWMFTDHMKSPDPRYRAIVKKFAEAGYLEFEKDEFQEAKRSA